MSRTTSLSPSFSNIIKLCVGGRLFVTSRSTLTKEEDSFLACLVSGKFAVDTLEDGSVFIDRDGKHFRHILNFLRDGRIPNITDLQARQELCREANFYGLTKLMYGLNCPDLVAPISVETLRMELQEYRLAQDEKESSELGKDLVELVDQYLQHIRGMVLQGCNSGPVPILEGKQLPPRMSFLARGKVEVKATDGSLRELPLKYHDWAGRHKKMDFVQIQEEMWGHLCDSALLTPEARILYDDAVSTKAIRQMERLLRSVGLVIKIERRMWLHITTPIYSSDGVRGDCPVVTDFCSVVFADYTI